MDISAKDPGTKESAWNMPRSIAPPLRNSPKGVRSSYRLVHNSNPANGQIPESQGIRIYVTVYRQMYYRIRQADSMRHPRTGPLLQPTRSQRLGITRHPWGDRELMHKIWSCRLLGTQHSGAFPGEEPFRPPPKPGKSVSRTFFYFFCPLALCILNSESSVYGWDWRPVEGSSTI